MQLFDRESANRMIPEMEALMKQIVEKRRHLTALQRQLQRDLEPGTRFAAEDDGPLTRRFEELDFDLHALVRRVHGMGAVIKDLEMGLVDFPAIIGRETVYLCWRLGEREVRYYHGVEEGFYGRKPLPQLKRTP